MQEVRGAHEHAIDGVLRKRMEVELQWLHAHALDGDRGVEQRVRDVVRAAMHERQLILAERWGSIFRERRPGDLHSAA